MEPIKSPISNEKGSMIILAMVFLVILTFIGIAATNRADLDTNLVISQKNHNEAFYDSDSGVSWSIANLTEGDVDTLADNTVINTGGQAFQITYLRTVSLNPTRIELQADSDPNINGSSRIIAGIELPTPIEGALEDTGEEATY
jgi:hypothetical protein